ncbi:MAG: hypothetical protein SNH01_03595 [Rikenellaceae bacterium]
MNRLWRIFLSLLFVAVMCGSCGSTTEESNSDQKEDIIDYLESSHSPKLIAESDIAESLVDEPNFYVMRGSTTFRYIEDYYNAERATKAEIIKGSNITMTFELYDFTSISAPTSDVLLYTNNAAYKSTLEELGLNTTYWSFEPKAITVGSGAIFSSVESLLVGCREGDTIEFYLTVDEAYGDSYMGVATLEAPLALFVYIDSVEN